VFDTGIDQNARTQCLEFVERKLEILCYRLKLKQPRLEQSGDNIELKLDCNCWQVNKLFCLASWRIRGTHAAVWIKNKIGV